MYIYVIILIIIFCLILLIINKFVKMEKKFKSSCWIDKKLYPEAKLIFENKDIIEKELINILDSDKWSIWNSYQKDAPIFTKMTNNEIKNKLEKSIGKINENKDSSWRLYGLILNSIPLETSKYCPKTMDILLKSSSRILNAGFSILEPGGETKPHKDYNNNFVRLHIPMIIPTTNIDYYKKNKTSKIIDLGLDNNLSIFQLEDDKRIWIPNEYFIFDDTCMHNAWNNTDMNRIVLLIDLLKK